MWRLIFQYFLKCHLNLNLFFAVLALGNMYWKTLIGIKLFATYTYEKKQTHQYWDCQTLFDGSLKLLCTEISSLLCGQSCIFVWSYVVSTMRLRLQHFCSNTGWKWCCIQYFITYQNMYLKNVSLVISCNLWCISYFDRYPDTWYQEITSNPKFYSLAATYHSRIIGIIVVEVKQLANTNKEVSTLFVWQLTSV